MSYTITLVLTRFFATGIRLVVKTDIGPSGLSNQLTQFVKTNSNCPEPASLLAPCVCSKNGVPLKVSQSINSSVRYQCSSNTADVASAQSFFSAYCALNAGTTAFPTPANPPGDSEFLVLLVELRVTDHP